jgi:predicted type IV restriction endonuclease
MADQQTARLLTVIKETVAKIARFQDRNLGEQNTKASLIEPVLEALGWDIRDPDEVHREFKPMTQDKPVDYALTLLRKPRLFVEAKGLGETLSDRRWIGQILGYATVAGVAWCVLTDGNEYRFYNAVVPLDADEKLFFRIKLSEGMEDESARILRLISRNDMAENLLEVLWKTHYVDRRVRNALQEMFTTRDKGVIRLIRRKVAELSPREINDSLRRLDIRIESPALVPETQGQGKALRPKRQKPGRKQRKEGKAKYEVSLKDIISAGLLSPPLKLFRKYKGKVMEATLLPDGGVDFEGTRYNSCSTAAEVSRSTITGRRMNTNGWDWWQYLDPNGNKLTLFDARQRFMAMKGQIS